MSRTISIFLKLTPSFAQEVRNGYRRMIQVSQRRRRAFLLQRKDIARAAELFNEFTEMGWDPKAASELASLHRDMERRGFK